MRVLLINANRFKQPWPVLPVGLCCVASTLKKADHETKVLDLCFSRKTEKMIRKTVADFNPEVVGIGIRNIDNCSGYHTIFLMDDIRKNIVLPLKDVFHGPIIIGGAAVGISAPEILTFLDLPYAIRGDGEAAMLEFLDRIEKRYSLQEMPGLVEQRGGKIIQNNPPMIIQNLDDLSFSRCWEWIDLKPYQQTGSPLLIQTKRGCTLTCAYCTYNQIEGCTWRLRSPKSVADEIEEALEITGIRQFEFTDSTFNIPLEHTKTVLREIISRKLNVRLQVMGINPAAVDSEFVSLLKEAGFTEVDLGVESGCNEILKVLGKRFDVKTIEKSGKLLHDAGISVRSWALLLGAPNETEKTVKKTLSTIRKAANSWEIVDIGIGIRVYKGAPIAKRMKREDPCCTEDNFFRPVTYVPYDITLDEIKILTKREALKYANFYMYDEDQEFSLALLITATWLLRLVAPNQPLWRIFIVLRKIEIWTGINFVRRIIHEIRYLKMVSNRRKSCARIDETLTQQTKMKKRA